MIGYVAELQAPLLGFATRKLRALSGSVPNVRDEARDVVQDAWLALCHRGVRADDRVPSLMFRIVQNLCHRRVARGRWMTRLPARVEELAPLVPFGWGGVATAEAWSLANTLTPTTLEAWDCRRRGLSPEDAGEAMGMVPATAAHAMFRARRLLEPERARACGWCGVSIVHMAPQARFCGRSHQTKHARARPAEEAAA